MPARPFRIGRARTGLGLFATRLIKKRTRIAEYKGPILDSEAADKAERRGNRYLYEVSKNRTIDGTPRGNIARYANHSCNPNAEIDHLARPRLHQVDPRHQAGRGDRLRLWHRLSEERDRPRQLPVLPLPAAARPPRQGTARGP